MSTLKHVCTCPFLVRAARRRWAGSADRRDHDNLGLTFGYKSTASEKAPDDLQLDVFMISLVYGWHPLIEGSKRLKGE